MKRSQLIIIIVSIISVALVTGTVILISPSLTEPAPVESTAAAGSEKFITLPIDRDTTAPATEETDAPDVSFETDAPDTEPSDSDAPVMDEELRALLSYQGITEDDLSAEDITQIITVTSSFNQAQIRFFEISGNRWTEDEALSCSGHVGEQGVTGEMSEYVSATPAGFFPVLDAFYIHSAPETGLETFQITEDTYWVDDPDSKYYNQRVEGTDDKDWSSAEHMIDYAAYNYGFVIGYNTACVSPLGSAIFFHIGSAPTAGCVSTSEDMVLSYLQKLSANSHPYILIN